jgi:protein O-mannosyl-transferase
MSNQAAKRIPVARLPGDADIGGHPRAGLLGSGRTSAALVLLAATVVAIVAWAHWPALSAQAISFDDSEYVDDSPLVRNPSWASAQQIFGEVLKPSTIRGYYHPLAMVSLMLDVARGGRIDRPEAFRQTNLLLHLMNTGLVIVLVYLCLGRTWPAAAAGLVFGLHPLTVEPVVWIAARKALLAASFSLWSLVLYVGYARHGGRKLYVASVIMYALALLSKPTSIPLPALMIVLDYWPLARFDRKRLVEKIPFFAVGAILTAIACVSHTRTATLGMPSGESLMQVPLLASYKLAFLLGKMFWPAHLSCYYQAPKPLALSNPVVLGSVIGMLALLAAVAISVRRQPAFAAGALFFLLAASPVLGLFTYAATWVFAFDNYLYLPMVGLLAPLAFALAWLWKRQPDRPVLAPRSWVALIVVVVLCGSETAATRVYLAEWRDSETLARYMLRLTPAAPLLHNHLALVLAGQGQTDEAIRQYSEALKLKPDYPEAWNNLGAALVDQRRPDEAVSKYAAALRLRPDYAEAHNNLAFVLLNQGQIDQSIAHCRRALELKPGYADAHNNLGLSLAALGQTVQAIAQYRRALQLKPDHMKAQNNLGIALIQEGHVDEAVAELRQAVRTKPDSPEAQNNLGLALREKGRIPEAIEHLQEALRLKPDYLNAHANLAIALAENGDFEPAMDHYRAALRIQPLDADLHCGLGELLQQRGRIAEAVAEYREALRIEPRNAVAARRLAAMAASAPASPR